MSLGDHIGVALAGAITTIVGAAVYAWRTGVRRRDDLARAAALADSSPEAARRETLRWCGVLQEHSQRIGAASAVLIEWRRTDRGGAATVIAEWSGDQPASAPKYQDTELGETYRSEVITPLRRAGWLVIGSDDAEAKLSPASNLADLYDQLGVGLSWVHILADVDGVVLYTSTRFTRPPTVEPSTIRSELRAMGVAIMESGR